MDFLRSTQNLKKIFHRNLTLLSNVKFKRKIFSNFVSSSKSPNLHRWLLYKIRLVSSNSFDVLTEIFESWNRITNLTLTNCFIPYWSFKKCGDKASQVVQSKYGISFDTLTEIFKRWSRNTNLTQTNCFITYWTLKKCGIKANQVLQSKYELSFHGLKEIF